MDRLFIQIDGRGNCINHPAFESNLIQAYGAVPSDWQPFIRVQRPTPGLYEVPENDEPHYWRIGDTWMDIWHLRPMTIAERRAKQQAERDKWANRPYAHNWSAWTFDEATCQMVPPIPRPAPVEGKIVFWCGAEGNWKEAPPPPNDGAVHQFNFDDWVWI